MNSFHSQDGERSVLGAMMLSQKAVREATRKLTRTQFYIPAHAEIFEAMAELYVEGTDIDFVTLQDRLHFKGKLDEVGGIDYLVQVAESVPSAANVKHYAKIVKRFWVMRRLDENCDSIKRNLRSSDSDGYAEAIQAASTMLQGLLDEATVEYGPDEVFEAMKSQKLLGHKSWLQCVNSATKDSYKGWPCSEITLVGADTGQGKTWLLCQSVGHSIFEEGRRVAIISLEMSAPRLWRRISRQRSGFWSQANANYLAGLEGNAEWERWEAEALSSDWLVYDTSKFRGDADANSIEEIERWCLEKHEIRPLEEIYIDYAGLITTSQKGEDYQKYRHIARKLSHLAQTLEIPIVLLAQAEEHAGARKGETRWKYRGSQEWLKEAGIGLIIDEMNGDDPLLEQYGLSGKVKVLRCEKLREGRDKWVAPLMFDDKTLMFKEVL